MFKNPPCNAGDLGSIPGQGTKIPDAAKQLSPGATTTEACVQRLPSPRTTTRVHVLQWKDPSVTQGRPHVPQLRLDTVK